VSVAGTWALAPGEAGYPACLGDLGERDSPTLFGAGRLGAIESLDHEATVTIVGSRRASSYGLRVAETLARELAAAGVAVVSGMALGVDAAAHRGALAGGGTTIAVLAGGPDVVYPALHRPLYERIVESGAVLSEHEPGTRARKQFFPARNRIMAALGRLVIIVEAAQPSGSLITADVAIQIGRTVGAVPGQLGARNARGTNALIKDGAQLIRDAQDVLDLLFGVGHPGPRPRPALEPPLDRVLELICAGTGTLDGLVGESGLAPREAAVAVSRLELLGLVVADPLGGYAPAHIDGR
jgi:DNA processing protein